MNITQFSIKKPIGISMIAVFFVVLGLFSFYRIGVELLPSINIPYVTVTVKYPGAGAEEIEQNVIKPLENALSSLSNLKHMTAVARPERAQITLEFEFWANVDTSAIDASQYVNSALSKLPDGIETPTVLKRDVDSLPIMEISVLSNKPLAEVYSKANDVFVETLQRASGVSDVDINGGREKEVAVEVDKEKLKYFNLSLAQIASRIEKENVLTPAGSTFNNQTETNVRLTSQYATPAELSTIHINTNKGIAVPLSSIAEVRAQDKRVSKYARTNGQDVVSLSVYKNSNANVVDTAKAVLTQLDQLRKDYPDYQFVIVTNTATYVEDALHNTLEALIEGLFTTGIVLYFFLRSWKSSAAVLIAIPTSLITTFFAIYLAGFTFNMLSLMGMSLCIGVLVDDSIVVLENIHTHLKMGKPADQAAEDGRNEIGTAAIAITLCDVVVFLPIAFMKGMTGQFFRQFGLTIVFATLCSLIVSFTLTPMLASQFFKKGVTEPKGKMWDYFDETGAKVIASYERILIWSFSHSKKIVIGVFVAVLLSVSLYYPLGLIGGEYMPKTDEGSFRISMQFPVGQSLDFTNAKVREVESYIMKQPEVKNYLSRVGQPAGNNGFFIVQLLDKGERSEDIWTITDRVRSYLRKKYPDAIIQVNATQNSMPGVSGGSGTGNLGGNSAPLQIEIGGPSLNTTVAASYKVQDVLDKTANVKDIRSSYTEGSPEYKVTVDRQKLRFYNVTTANVNNAFSSAITGMKAGYYTNDPNNDQQDTEIRVRFKGGDGFNASDIASVPISTNSSNTVNLGSVASIDYGASPVMLRRVDKRESINVSANFDQSSLQYIIDTISTQLKGEKMGDGITYRFTGQADNMKSTFLEMGQAIGLSLLLVYILLAVLYESLSTPIIRMFSLPFGLIGSFVFLAVTRNTINLYSLLGILVMDGLVAKNGTLLLDYALTLMHRGEDARTAIIESAKSRLRPIFMTTVTMITGMLPTALALTPGSETRVSMAWVVIGGLISSTFFTLIAIPLIFLWFDQFHFPWHKIKVFLTGKIALAKKRKNTTPAS